MVFKLIDINPNIVKLEYAVRGPIVAKANAYEQELKSTNSLPFTEIVKCNIGDCHATGQSPISFFRQVMAVLMCPELMPQFPQDVQARAKSILDSCPGKSVGSYSQSTGVVHIRKVIAKFIETRDKIACNFENVFLSSGASEAIKAILSLISTGLSGKDRAGIMIPIPQYPLYSATVAELNEYQIGYYLDEANNWGLCLKELQRALNEAKEECKPRAICIINPGNPTGQVLSKADMEMVIRFAHEHHLMILADEVYQFNVYDPANHPWHSFRSVLFGMGAPFATEVQLVSFMSASKGYMGECGLRGGYGEIVNMDEEVKMQLYKFLSARLCPSVIGQSMIGMVCDAPVEGEASYEAFCKERTQVLTDLHEKAALMHATLNSLEGVTCNRIMGAMYAFPRITLPPSAVQAAESKGVKPDFMYCSELLESKGICVIPGSGFGQKPGTFHFRITILPPVEKMKKVMSSMKEFHQQFMKKYSTSGDS